MSILDNMVNEKPKNTKKAGSKKKSTSSFKEEYATDLATDVSKYGIQSYSKSGVTFEKMSEIQAKIMYSGLLIKSGAQEVDGVYGYGSNQNWENISTISLKKEAADSYMGIVPIEYGKNINMVFKDSAENWDNNSGMNYTFVN